MIDHLAFVKEWEFDIRRSLEPVPEELLSEYEQSVMRDGLIIPNSAADAAAVERQLLAIGLSPEADLISFFTIVGSIYLIGMGPDDAILKAVRDVARMENSSPVLFSVLAQYASKTTLSSYLSARFVDDPLVTLPAEILNPMVAISTTSGANLYGAVRLGSGNNFVRISAHGDTVKYSSFDEFLINERAANTQNLRDSLEHRD